jgi:hypothetical protein
MSYYLFGSMKNNSWLSGPGIILGEVLFLILTCCLIELGPSYSLQLVTGCGHAVSMGVQYLVPTARVLCVLGGAWPALGPPWKDWSAHSK